MRRILAASTLALIFLAGCAGDGDQKDRESVPTVSIDPETAVADPELESTSPDAGDEFSRALAERDQFMEDQQLPLDGSALVATTPEQIAFVDAQRAYVESQGGVWSSNQESIVLALTVDACETSILNFHDISTSTVSNHVMSSPLFAALLTDDMSSEERAAGEANLASVMVYGMQYICPNDHPQWQAAFDELY